MLVNRARRAMNSAIFFQPHRARFLIGVVLVTLSLPACARAKRHSARSSYVARSVGEIWSINFEAGFAVIDAGSSGWPAEIGTTVIARDSDGNETARLKVAQERKNSFVTAEIASGKPNKGDKIYQ